VICVCVKQTFTQASATKWAFAEAFSIALNAYVTSTVRDEANNAIKEFLKGWDRLESKLDGLPVEQHLGDIIKNLCLCMWLSFEYQQLPS